MSRYRNFNIRVKLATLWGWSGDSAVNLLEDLASVSSTYSVLSHNCL